MNVTEYFNVANHVLTSVREVQKLQSPLQVCLHFEINQLYPSQSGILESSLAMVDCFSFVLLAKGNKSFLVYIEIPTFVSDNWLLCVIHTIICCINLEVSRAKI